MLVFFLFRRNNYRISKKKTITEQIVEQTRYIWRIVRYKNFGCPDSGQTTDLLGVCIVIEGFHRHWRYTSSLRMSIVIYGVYRYWRWGSSLRCSSSLKVCIVIKNDCASSLMVCIVIEVELESPLLSGSLFIPWLSKYTLSDVLCVWFSSYDMGRHNYCMLVKKKVHKI